MGIAAAIAYYALVQLAEGLLRGDRTPVALALWLPNLVMTTVAGVLIVAAGRRTSDGDRGAGKGSRTLLERFGVVRTGIRVKRFALPRYVAGQFLRMVVICAAGLVIAYLIIDVFDNLKWFNRYGATAEEIARYYIARLPVLASRVIPMSLLIAVALTISVLGANGELLGMRACGIPILRILAPIWMLCALAVPADHLLANELVPRSSERAREIKRNDIKGQVEAPEEARERVWYRVGKRIHEMERLDLLSGLARQITLYELGKDGLPKRRTDASGARYVGEGNWLLDEPRSVELRDGTHLERKPQAERVVQFGEEAPAEIETADLTPAELRATIDDPDLEGPIALAYRTDLQMKISAPLACLLLPLIALFFAATGPPFPRPVQTLIASADHRRRPRHGDELRRLDGPRRHALPVARRLGALVRLRGDRPRDGHPPADSLAHRGVVRRNFEAARGSVRFGAIARNRDAAPLVGTGAGLPSRTQSEASPPLVWLLMGDRVGDNSQVLGLGEALGWPLVEKHFIYTRYEKLVNLPFGAHCSAS